MENISDSIANRNLELENEAEWGVSLLKNVLGDALLPDGNIDFDTLDELWKSKTGEGLYLEENNDGAEEEN